MKQTIYCFERIERNEQGQIISSYLRAQYGKSDIISAMMGFEFTSVAELAGHVDPENYDLVVSLYHRLVDRYGEDSIRLVKVDITIETNVVSLEQGEYLEERRRRAIDKLRPDEYKILGIEQLGVYHKLKYHGT